MDINLHFTIWYAIIVIATTILNLLIKEKRNILGYGEIDFTVCNNKLSYIHSKQLKCLMPIIDKYQSELIELTKRCLVIWEGM